MLNIKSYPTEIQNYLINKDIEENLIGCENSQVYKISGSNNSSIYLKVKPEDESLDLKNEYNKTLWLSNKISVPKVLHYSVFDRKEFFLMEEVKGYMSYEIQSFSSHKEIVILIAKELKKLHSLDISNCPFKEDLKVKIPKAKYNVKNGFVDESDFDEENLGKTSTELLQELLSNIPENEDLVLTHGDFCMPNIIIDKKLNVGLIDLGRSGIADRYQDISLILRSITGNFDTEIYDDLFLSEYGIKEINYEKLKFYTLLDEFF